MNVEANLTSRMVSEVPQDGSESELTFVFLGVVAGTMIMFLAATVWAWRKEQKEKEMVREFLECVARFYSTCSNFACCVARKQHSKHFSGNSRKIADNIFNNLFLWFLTGHSRNIEILRWHRSLQNQNVIHPSNLRLILEF